MSMNRDDVKVLIDAQTLVDKVSELGRLISNDYKDKNLTLVSVLKGSFIFAADLARSIDIDCKIDFMSVSSYGSKKKSSGEVKIIKDLDIPLEGVDLLIAEDILDSGLTLTYLKSLLMQRNPRSVKICTLLDKPSTRSPLAEIVPDYVGFTVPDKFLVGYGLDDNEFGRNLPFVGYINT